MVISAVLLPAVSVANCGEGLGHLKDGSLLACSHSNCRAPHHMSTIPHHLVPDISGFPASFSCSAAPAAGTLPAGQTHLHSMKTENHTSSTRQPADAVQLNTKSISVSAICRQTQTNNRSQVPASSTAVRRFSSHCSCSKAHPNAYFTCICNQRPTLSTLSGISVRQFASLAQQLLWVLSPVVPD